MPVRWIVCDVDGCLAPEESVPWDLEPLWRLAALSRAASAGESPLAPLTLCTGRPQAYAEVLMKLLDVRAPAICENGAVFYNLRDNRAWYGPGVTADKIRALRRLRVFLETELLPAWPGAVLQFSKEAQVSIFSATPTIFPQMREAIEAFLERDGGAPVQISASHYYLNLSLRGVDKGGAVRALLRTLGVRRDEVAGIGDTEGDLPLREAVGFFACPANATPEIRAAADYVSPFPLVEGVLDILARPECRRA